jgi:CRP/FNR family transcriptional regulator, cyclic AMP receptor protein
LSPGWVLLCSTVDMEWNLLAGLPDGDRQRVLESARRRRFDKGEVLFHEGDSGTSLYLLESGRVAVRITTPAGVSATLTVVAPGEAFGEMALLHRSSIRTATAVALEEVTTLLLERQVFVRLCVEHPRVERLLVGVLAARVERLSGHLVEALYLGVEKRVLRRLLELCRVYSTPGAATVVLPLTQEDLAGLVGTTRPTVNTQLRQLQYAGIVALSRGRVEVLDMGALERASR